MRRIKKLLFIILTFLWLGIIFSFSLQSGEESSGMSMGVLKNLLELFSEELAESYELMPREQMELIHNILRKCAHFSEYLVLGMLTSIALFQINVRPKVPIAISFCVLSAAADETLQRFVSGRAGRFTDVLIDSAGALAGIGIVFLILKAVYNKFIIDK